MYINVILYTEHIMYRQRLTLFPFIRALALSEKTNMNTGIAFSDVKHWQIEEVENKHTH